VARVTLLLASVDAKHYQKRELGVPLVLTQIALQRFDSLQVNNDDEIIQIQMLI